MKDHYDVSHLPEGQSEPGSRGRVLRNLLEISGRRQMDLIESQLLAYVVTALLQTTQKDHRFSAGDVRTIHRLWLGSVYSWAGQYRQVNISKGNFPFPPAAQVARLMTELEGGPLLQFTPCLFENLDQTTKALAAVHTEFVLIHPFREGNGRTARVLSTLMAAQAGVPPLDFSVIRGRVKEQYFAAVRAGLARDYKPMEEIFRGVISTTLRASET